MKRKIVIFAITVIIVFFIIGLENKTFSKYVSKGNTQLGMQIAIPITNDNREGNLSYRLEDIIPGEEKTYSFNVVNYNNGIIGNINMKYNIEITKSNNIPVTISLIKNDSLNSCLDENLVCGPNILSHSAMQTDRYVLKINWNESSNLETYKNLTDYINIKIASIQEVD